MTTRVPALQNLINKEIAILCNNLKPDVSGLYDPISYILSLGGKRVRPVFLLMAHELFGGNSKNAMPQALAVEIFHNFTLIHDDIMDKAPLRRNKPAVHCKWNVNTGILSGDAMLIEAYRQLTKCDSSCLPAVLKIFNRIALKVCEGQHLDMSFENLAGITIASYLRMTGLKTAALLAGSMQIGALTAGASQEESKHIYDFGFNIGIAFQLQDDILDIYGDTEKFGKQKGGDIIENKKTFLILKALELADTATKKELVHIINKSHTENTDKVEAVKSIYDRLNVKQEADKVMKTFLNNAFIHIDKITVGDDVKNDILDYINGLMIREK